MPLEPLTDQLSPNFRRKEFACRCGCGLNAISMELVHGLQKLRDIVKRPIVVTSGLRCVVWNEKQGGSRLSRHLLGQAADIRVAGMSARTLFRYAQKIPALRGIGVSDEGNFIHVDVRPVLARWCYENGREVKWHDA